MGFVTTQLYFFYYIEQNMLRSIARQSLIKPLLRRSLSTRAVRMTPAWVNAARALPAKQEQRRSLLISSVQWQQQYTIT